jgi:hypothetical protein
MKLKLSILLVLALFAFFLPSSATDTKYRVIKLLNKGWIKGRVTHSNPNMEMPKLEIDRDIKSCGAEPRKIEAVSLSPDGGLRNAVVYLKDISAGKDFTIHGEPPVLQQTHCDYVPHVQVVPSMSSIKIENNDSLLHSVHAFWFPYGSKFVLYPSSVTYPAKTLFNIAMVAQRKESFQQLGASGIIKFICEAGHYWMTAYAVIEYNPYFVKVDDDGNYELDDVPPGKYTLVCWHEYFGTKEQQIVVKENQPTEIDFQYTEEL